MELADPRESYAVLIGASSFDSPGFDGLPAVANNITELARLLEDPTVWGLPPGHCLRLPQPSSAEQVLDAVRTAGRLAKDTLLVYYAGHGTQDRVSNELLLTLPSSDPDRSYTMLPFESVRREVLSIGTGARSVSKVVILDCCYSGSAMTGGMSGPVEMAERARIAGTYLLTASSATSLAQAPPGETYTAFTGELVHLLRSGLPGGEHVIGLNRMYEHLLSELRAKGRPTPQQRLSNSGRNLAFARNRYGLSGEADQRAGKGTGTRQVPERFKPSLRGQPRQIAAEAANLLRTEQSGAAAELLTLAAALRPAQEAAALAWVLRREARHDDAERAMGAMAEREPAGVVACIEALHAMDDAEDAERLIALTAAQEPEQIAGTVKALHAARLTAEAERLLSLAMGRHRTTERILVLAGALWSAGLDADADQILRAATTSSPEEAARLADALLMMGHKEQKAFDLYLQAAAVTVRRSAPDLVRVLRAMDEGGREADADRLLLIATEAAATGREVRYLCEALWSTGMEDRVLDVLAAAATTLSDTQVLELADALRAEGNDSAVLHFLKRAARSRPVTRTMQLAGELRAMGRPVDANHLLTDAAARPAEDVATLLCHLEGPAHRRDHARVVDAVKDRPLPELASLARALRAAGRSSIDVLATVALKEKNEFLQVLRALHTTGDHDVVHMVLDDLVCLDRPLARERLGFLEESQAFVGAILLRAALAAGDADATLPPSWDDFRRTVGPGARGLTNAERVAAMEALCAAGMGRQVEEAMAEIPRILLTSQIVELLSDLSQVPLHACAHAVMRSTRWKSPHMHENFIVSLHAAGLQEYAEFALRLHTEALGSQLTAKLAHALDVADSYAPAQAPARKGLQRIWRRTERD